MKLTKPYNPIILFALLEGFIVMGLEIISARFIAPFYGTSLNVWGTVIGFTLFFLACGYFLGGYLSRKYATEKNFLRLLSVIGLAICLMPFMTNKMLFWFNDKDPFLTIFLFTFLLLCIPFTLMGTVPVVLVHLCTPSKKETGKISGSVFALSSMGGIAGSFLTGHWLVPDYGLNKPVILFGLLISIIPFFRLLTQKDSFAFLFLFSFLIGFLTIKKNNKHKKIKPLYISEGLLGQIMVTDVTFYNEKNVVGTNRILFNNRIGQTWINLIDQKSRWDYVNFIISFGNSIKQKSEVLLLGLGGGTVANQLIKEYKFNVDAIELDPRFEKVAKKYFSLDPSCTVILDDARHFIRTTTKKYKLIIFDLFRGETSPGYALSYECFQETKGLLKENGLMVINFNGIIEGEHGLATRSLIMTLKKVGFEVDIIHTFNKDEERNSIIVAFEKPYNFREFSSKFSEFYPNKKLMDYYTHSDSLNFIDAKILYDDKPEMELMTLYANSKWRKNYNLIFAKRFQELGLEMFE